MIGLCSKSYCTEKIPESEKPEQVKFSMKGVNEAQFKNPMPHYEHVLTTKQILESLTKESAPEMRV